MGLGDGDFVSQATAAAGGASGAQAQAIGAMAGWDPSAQQAVLGQLQNAKKWGAIARGAAAAATGQMSDAQAQALFALAASALPGGVVLGAVAAALPSVLNTLSDDVIMPILQTLGLSPPSRPPPDQMCGWVDVTKGQIIPNSPSDQGVGTYQNPGWQRFHFEGVRCNPDGTISFDTSVLPAAVNGASGIDNYMAGAWCELQSLPKSDFRWFFYPLLFRNMEYAYNCHPTGELPTQGLLAKAIQVWNDTHDPAPGDRPWDPRSPQWGDTYKTVPLLAYIIGGFGYGYQGTSMGSQAINGGAVKSVLNIPGGVITGGDAGKPSSTATKVAVGTAVAAGATAAGIGVWAWLTHQTFGAASARLYDETVGRAWRATKRAARRSRR